MQAILAIPDLPERGLDSSAVFHTRYMDEVKTLLGRADTLALAIVMPSAGADHDDWRRTLARDLARAYTPKRVNVVGASDAATREALLIYLRDAPGLTGQYLAGHD